MNYLKKISLIIAVATIPAPAFADEFFAVTPSGATEMLFSEAPDETVGLLTGKCIDVKWTVI